MENYTEIKAFDGLILTNQDQSKFIMRRHKKRGAKNETQRKFINPIYSNGIAYIRQVIDGKSYSIQVNRILSDTEPLIHLGEHFVLLPDPELEDLKITQAWQRQLHFLGFESHDHFDQVEAEPQPKSISFQKMLEQQKRKDRIAGRATSATVKTKPKAVKTKRDNSTIDPIKWIAKRSDDGLIFNYTRIRSGRWILKFHDFIIIFRDEEQMNEALYAIGRDRFANDVNCFADLWQGSICEMKLEIRQGNNGR